VSCDGDAYQLVSLIQLIANPGEYHETVVVAVGIAELGPEGQALFLHREDFENGNIWNAVALDAQGSQYRHLNGKYTSVRGCFRADQHGHLGMFFGTITGIERFVEMFSE
jgi:hypothetical protein